MKWNIIVPAALLAVSCSVSQTSEKPAEYRWNKIGPGGGGATFIPTFSYKTPETFLVRCDMTGSYLTGDGGKSYSQINYANGASAYAFDPRNEQTIYIGSTFLNRSTDGGKSWHQLFPPPAAIQKETYSGDHATYNAEIADTSVFNPRYDIGAIKVDPNNSSNLYISMGPSLLYSLDAGKSWRAQPVGQHILSLYTDASDTLFVFAGTSIFTFNKSTYKLSEISIPAAMTPVFSWTAGKIKNSGATVIYALHHDTNKEISGEFGYSEVWRSQDGGRSFNRIGDKLITNSSSGINPSYSMIACAESDAAQAYVVCNRYEEKVNDKMRYWYGALKTGDAGDTWQWVWKGGGGSGQYGVKDGIGVLNLQDAWTDKAFGGEYIRLMDVGVYPQDGNTAIVTDWYRTMKTTDGGKTWQQIYSDPQPDGSFASRGLDVTTAYGVHFDPFDKNHIAISYTDIGYHHSFNGGKTWTRSAEGVPAEWVNTCYWMVFDPAVKNKVWSVWSGMHDFPRGKMTRSPSWKKNARGGVCVSADGGKTWQPSVEGMGFDSPATSIVLDTKSPAENRILYVSVYNKGVFKSTDGGKTWTLKNKGLDENTAAFELTLSGNGALYLTVSATPAHRDGKKGRDFYSGAVYRSRDGAESWEKLNVSDGWLFPNGIESDPDNPDRLYLACWADIDLSDLVGGDVARATGGNEKLSMKGGIFRSDNGGDTWTSVFDEKQYVYDVTADPHSPGVLYCNTFNRAAYRSDDYGKTWEKIKGYDFHWGQRVIVDPYEQDKIYLTTFGSSVLVGTRDGKKKQ